MTKITLPPIGHKLVDDAGKTDRDWYDKLKFLERLQPLSDIPAAEETVLSIDGETGDFTLDYGLSRSTLALSASLSSSSAALGADVSLNNTANYFDGPSITLGTGTWFVTATVLVSAGTIPTETYCKLWDGTTVISSTSIENVNATRPIPAALSGIITNPAAAVKISCRNPNSADGTIYFNHSGNSKDSHITAVRIA